MTHIRNVEAFTELVNYCTGFGGAYNPGHANLQIEALQQQVGEVRACMEKVDTAKAKWDWISSERRHVYRELPKLAARVLRYLEASRASDELMADVRRYFRELIGKKRAGSSLEVRQLAFTCKVDSFSKLVTTIQGLAHYQPNEADLQLQALEQHVEWLRELNHRVDLARQTYRQAIIQRDHLLYRDYYSLAKNLWAVKKYVRALFGWGSAQYNLIRKFEIVKPQLG